MEIKITLLPPTPPNFIALDDKNIGLMATSKFERPRIEISQLDETQIEEYADEVRASIIEHWKKRRKEKNAPNITNR